jgi:hypothetical protein
MISSEVNIAFFSAIDNADLQKVNDYLDSYPDLVLCFSEEGDGGLSIDRALEACKRNKEIHSRLTNESNVEALKNSTRIANIILSKTLTAIIEVEDEDDIDLGIEIIALLASKNRGLLFKKLQNGLTPLEYAQSKGNDAIADELELVQPYIPEASCTMFRPMSPSDWSPEALLENTEQFSLL